MINEANQITVPYVLSDAIYNAYEKIKELILRIFSLIKLNDNEKNLKEEFYESYVDFARKLDAAGYNNESTSYMLICSMYYRLMDRPNKLIAHEKFFMDLFDAFDEILDIRIHKSEEYDEKYLEFLKYLSKMQQYYYTEVAVPSKYYDKQTCAEIIGHLAGDLDE